MSEYNEYNEHDRLPESERTNYDEDTFVERRSDEPHGEEIYNERRGDSEETPRERVEGPRERRYDPAGERPYEERRNEAFGAAPSAGPWWRTWSAGPARRVGCLLPLLLLLVALLLGGLIWGSLSGPILSCNLPSVATQVVIDTARQDIKAMGTNVLTPRQTRESHLISPHLDNSRHHPQTV